MAKIEPGKKPLDNPGAETVQETPVEEKVVVTKADLDSMQKQIQDLRGLVEVAGNSNRIRQEERKNFKPWKMKFSISLYKENEQSSEVITKWVMINNEVDTVNGKEVVNQKYKLYFSKGKTKIITLDEFRMRVEKTEKLEAEKVYTADDLEIRPTLDEKWRVLFQPPKVYSETIDQKTGRPMKTWREWYFADITYNWTKYQIENLYLN